MDAGRDRSSLPDALGWTLPAPGDTGWNAPLSAGLRVVTAPLLVVGFGPFLEVTDNPAGILARAVDGEVVLGVSVVGRVMPVTWEGSVAYTASLVMEHQPRLVLGVGVARGRAASTVESVGRRWVDPVLPDVDGVCVADLEPDGPALRRASIDCERFAAALDAEVSEDAGAYVCNAWLYQALGHLDLPTGFLHIPPAGMDAARLLRGLAALVAASRASATGG